MLKLVKKEDCSSIENRGTRKSDRKKLENRKREMTTTKEIIRIIKDQKYRYQIYWDKKWGMVRSQYMGKVL